MGFAKRLLEEKEEQRHAGIQIALEASVLKRCEYHEEVYDPSGGDIESAYRLGNAKFTKGQLKIFKTRREMTDAIQEAVKDAAMECYTCAKIRDE